MGKRILLNDKRVNIVADADFEILIDDDVASNMRHTTIVAICFYSDSNGSSPITPTAGTIDVVASMFNGDQYHKPSSGDSSIQATDVKAAVDGDATYTLPSFVGSINKVKLTMNGVVGATHFKFLAWRG